jgi:proline dehydrogenase
MTMLRTALLRASESRWLATQLPRWPFARRAVRKFMPGETVAAALDAAAELAREGVGTVVTELGENVTTLEQAEAEARSYRATIDEIARRGLASEPSIKLTHLGLDLRRDACETLTLELAAYAAQKGNFLWIDMEGSAYTGVTIEVFRKVHARVPRVGLALQAYLRRTPQDLTALLPLDPAIRIVKGAYAEPAGVAFPSKREVDLQYLAHARTMLEAKAAGRPVRLVCGTHDLPLIERVQGAAGALGLARDAWEVHMLYGIRTLELRRLAAAGHVAKVLISFGSAWFAWYMRRLAERPANVLFAVRSLVG